MKIDILHVYAGTSGAAGLYIHEMYTALSDKFSQEAIVSYNFSFDYGKKWFYKYTDLSYLRSRFFKIDKIRYLIRFFELLITLLKIYIFITINKVKIINYSLTSDLLIELFLLKVLRRLNKITVVITCHDVVPFGSEIPKILAKKIKRKSKFFNLAHYLIVHNLNSQNDLEKYYNINHNRIIHIPFPIMDLNKLPVKTNNHQLNLENAEFRVGIFGQFRQEKGLDILIDAWEKFFDPQKNVQLVIAGNVPYNLRYNFKKIQGKSAVVLKRYIEDALLIKLIEKCDLVVLPYKRGTNSGIPSSVLSFNSLVLTSDIPMFINNELINKDFMFRSGDSDDLKLKMEWLYTLNKNKLRDYKKNNAIVLSRYSRNFNKELKKQYSFILTSKE